MSAEEQVPIFPKRITVERTAGVARVLFDNEPFPYAITTITTSPSTDKFPSVLIEICAETVTVDDTIAKAPQPIATTALAESRADLEALPVGSIVMSAAGRVAARWDETKFTQMGDERAFESWSSLSLPCRVLFVGNGSHEAI